MRAHSQQVVTYSSSTGQTVNLCTACAERRRSENDWPRDGRGQEMVDVRMGLHHGRCADAPAPVRAGA